MKLYLKDKVSGTNVEQINNMPLMGYELPVARD